jgi:hypothetical protein
MDKSNLSKEYETTFTAMIRKVAETSNLREPLLTSFWPMCGLRYRSETGLFLIGRAVNGWTVDWTREQVCQGSQLQRVVHETRTCSEPEDKSCPMAWVKEYSGEKKDERGKRKYNTNRSAFWRMAKKTLRALQGDSFDEDNWYSHMAWSNLYKVSPGQPEDQSDSDFKGNPSNRLCRAQCPHVADLLDLEMATFRPRRILVIVGLNWFDDPANGDFKRRLGVELIPGQHGKHVEAVGCRSGETWVITQRPEGKLEESFLAEVSAAFASHDSK